MNVRVFAAVAVLLTAVSDIHAQPARGGGRPRDDAQRKEMEQRLQARIDSIVRVRIVLTDDQLTKLRDVATRVEKERRDLRMEEGRTRVDLRRELTAATPNEERIAELLEVMPKYERRRIDLHEREQRELAKFLSASQRARYVALQEELRSNMQQMQRRRLGLDGPADSGGRRGGPPGKPPRNPPPR